MRWLFVLLLAATSSAHADTLRGKRLYYDAARVLGTGVSCVDCHGALPGGLFGIGSAANDPALVANAIATIPQMAPFRDHLMTADLADLAAYIGDPAVPSPSLVVTADRIQFGEHELDTASRPASLEVRNTGSVAFALTGAPEVWGTDATEFSIITTDCSPDLALAPGQSCRIYLVFAPTGFAGDRAARVVVSHDWIHGIAAVALLGSAREAPPMMSPSEGCAAGRDEGGFLLVLALFIVGSRRKTIEERHFIVVVPSHGSAITDPRCTPERLL